MLGKCLRAPQSKRTQCSGISERLRGEERGRAVLQRNNHSYAPQKGNLRFLEPSVAGHGLRRHDPRDRAERLLDRKKRRMRHIHLVGDRDVVCRGGSRIVLPDFGKSSEAGDSYEQQEDCRSEEKRLGKPPALGMFANLHCKHQG